MNRTSIFAISLFLVFGIVGGVLIAYGNTPAGLVFLIIAAIIIPLFMFVPRLLTGGAAYTGGAGTTNGWSIFGKILVTLLIIALCFWGVSKLLNMKEAKDNQMQQVMDTNPNQTTSINVERGDVNITNHNAFHNTYPVKVREVVKVVETKPITTKKDPEKAVQNDEWNDPLSQKVLKKYPITIPCDYGSTSEGAISQRVNW